MHVLSAFSTSADLYKHTAETRLKPRHELGRKDIKLWPNRYG